MSTPRISRTVAKAAANIPTESALQTTILEGLRRLGYEVLEVGRWRRQVRCPCGCGKWFTPTGGNSTPGCPDLLVTRREWCAAGGPLAPGSKPIWLGLEVKTPAGSGLFGTVAPGRVKPAQQRLADLGMTALVHSWEEALAVVEGFVH